jgi:hypothetical protein
MWSERLLGLWRAALEARTHFNASDGWAIASHIALSILISLFPFLIVVTGVSGLVGSENLAREAGACCSTLGQKRSLPRLQRNLNGSRRPHKVRPSPQARFSPSILRRAQSKAFDSD